LFAGMSARVATRLRMSTEAQGIFGRETTSRKSNPLPAPSLAAYTWHW
jgi:hypothetical protein